MKTVFNTKINQVMKNYMKFICAILMLLGTSAHALGAIYIEYDGNKYYNGNTITINVDLDDDIVASADAMTIKNDGTGWTSSTWYYGYIYATISGTYVYSNLAFGMAGVEGNNGTPYWIDEDHYTSFYEWNNWQYETLSFYTSYAFDAAGTYNSTITVVQKDDNDASTLQSATITVSYVVTAVCTNPTVAFESENVYKDKDASSFTKTATAKVGGSSTGQTISYSSSNTDVATVNPSTGAVTLKGVVGSTVITATAAEVVGEYCEGTGSYTLYVYTNPTVNTTGLAGVSRTPTSVTYKGCQVSDKGGLDIVSYGFVIGTSSSVDWSTKVASAGANANIALNTDFGTFTTSDLTPGTTYYIKGFAYNGKAFGYTTHGNFTTPYLITLDKNGGDADGSAYVLPNATTLTNISEPTKTGYHVEGYYTTSGVATKVATDEGALQASIEVSSTEWTNSSSQWKRGAGEKFYAKWAANTYTVSFDQNGGSGGSSSVTATYGSAMPSATMPTTPPSGKTFDGYYYNSVQYYDADGNSAHTWDVAEDVTLVASWTTATPTLKIASVDNVVISSTSPVLAENGSASVSYGSTVTLSHGDPASGYYWLGWNVYETGNESNTVTVTSDQFTMPEFDVTVSANLYTSLVFSCSELTLTAHPETADAPIFITSTAEKKVRSQGYITITGSGLTPSTDLTFPGLNSKFEVLTSTGGTISTNASGAINVDAYIFYTPDAGDTSDGLDKMTGLAVSVGGAKPKQANLTQDIIGRHLPTAGYVIAGKKDNKWYALPSNMASTSTPDPSEIAVDDINNPTIAYTDASNIYGLEGPTTSGGGNNIASGYGQYVRLTMSIESSSGSGKPAPLFGTSGSEDASSSPKIGKSGTAIATNNLSEGWWWELTQTNTSITNPQDAKYTIKCANNSNTLSIKNSPFVWGLYASGVEELRLIPASDIPYTEAYFVEWGQHGGVIEVDAEGIDANSVTATLNGTTRGAISFAQTLTNGKGRASIYDYTVNFGNDINFAAAASNGALLTLKWTKNAVVKAVTSIVVPKIIASSATMKSIMSGDNDWKTEVHVLPGVTLTANAGDFESNDVLINQLEIYPGATVVVTKGSQASGTLKVKTLVLRNGWTRAGVKAYDVARLYITPTTASLAKNAVDDVWYADWYIDYDQYYPIAVPWDVTIANITYRYCSVEPTVGHDKNIRLRYYDGSSRAGGGAIGTNWKLYGAAGATSVPTKLEPSKGYALTAKRPSGKAFSILRMPLTIPSAAWTAGGEKGEVSGTHKDQVSVTGWGSGTAQWYAMGWNFIGNPYMCTFNGDDDGISGKLVDQQGKGVRYATIPDVDFKNYDQVAIADADLKPASGFFIQAENPEATYITFASSNIVPPSAPTRFKTTTEAIPEQEAYIRLSYEGGKDQMGLIIGEDYTANYEVNADLAKVLGDAGFVKTYMQYGGMDMAYVAINSMLAQQWIPVTVILPTSGEYTFSLTNSSVVEQLEGVYLIDYANDNQVTNLIDEDYVFTSEAGTIGNRFSINAIVGERQTPTDIDVINSGGDLNSDKPVKFLYRDKVYIYHRGIIYDATGKRVREINK